MYQQLDEKSAYLLRHPIRVATDMPKQVEVNKIEEVDKEWDERNKGMWWYHKNKIAPKIAPHITFDTRLFDLRDRLLTFAGSEVCMPIFEEDLENILSRGQLWYGDRIHMMKGVPCHCHQNSAYCWKKNKDKTVLCTGYALSKDGMWRQHSWLVHLRPRKNRIIETTVERELYFGYVMTEEESQNFYENCI